MRIAIPSVVLALALLLLAPAAPAATGPKEVLRGIPHQALFGLAFDGARGYAVGAGGQIMTTADAGKSWAPEKSPSALSLLGVGTRAGRAIAVGQMGLVLVRKEQGEWQPVKTEVTERLMAVDMNSQGLAVAVGSFGTVLKSTDGGASWSNAAPDWAPLFAADSALLGDSFHPHLYGVQVRESGEIVIAGELSLVMSSTNEGRDWRLVNRGVLDGGKIDPSIFGLRIREDGVGYAVGQAGLVLKTIDGGQTWRRLPRVTQAILLGVETTSDGQVLVTGMREMMRSRDDGASWRRIQGGDLATAWYSAAIRPEGGTGIVVVGHSGKILSVSK